MYALRGVAGLGGPQAGPRNLVVGLCNGLGPKDAGPDGLNFLQMCPPPNLFVTWACVWLHRQHHHHRFNVRVSALA